MCGFFLLPVLVAFSGYAAQAQAPALAPEPAVLVGTYRLSYQPDSTNPATRTDILYLLLGKTLSKFQSRGEQAGDSLLAVFEAVPFNQETGQLLAKQMDYLPRSPFHYSIYKTATAQRLYFYDRIGLAHYRYEEPALTWAITPTTATVAGYACQRATASYGGRQWEAWFTREVPVSEGPYKFSGLPGLIVKVGDTRQHYVFELASLKKPATERLITLPKKVPTSTDRATFRQALATYNLDPMGNMTAAGAQISISSTDGSTQEQIQQRARERVRKRNNPLELR